jgi:PAS domain S-box-containing protein
MTTNIKTALIVFLFSVTILVLYVGLKFFVYSGSVEHVALNNGEKKIIERERFLQSYLDSGQNKIEQIRKSNSFGTFLSSGFSDDMMLSELLKTIISCNEDIIKIKFVSNLGLDVIGYESSSKDKTKGIEKIFATNSYHLEYFFENAKKKNLEKVYFSQIELNRSNIPILRIYLPIKHNNEFGGVLYMDLDMSLVFGKFQDAPIYDMIIIDDDGFTLLHYLDAKSWGFYKNPQINLIDQYPMINTTNYLRTDNLVYHKLDLPFEKNLNLILKLKSDHIEYQKQIEKQEVIVISFIVVIISLLLSIFLSKIINRLNSNINNLQTLKDSLEIQKKEFETLFHSTRDGLAVVDMLSNFIKVNKSFCEITGFSEKEILQNSCFGFSSQTHIELSQKVFEDVKKFGYVENFEKVCVFGEKHKTVHINMALLPDNKSILISLRDVENLKLNEQQTKLASMGEMIGNIAHQWRQPLSTISVIASGLKMRQEFGQIDKYDISEDMDSIIKQTNYLSNTIDDFRNFIKKTGTMQPVSLVDMINKALNILESSLRSYHIEIVKDTQFDLTINSIENEIIQGFLNIFNNAIDALRDTKEENEDKYIFITTKREENGICIDILDNAGGVQEDILNRIFEPYFTTKHQSFGTGLGLSMSYEIIVTKYKGNISIGNKKFIHNEAQYKGACFTICFYH